MFNIRIEDPLRYEDSIKVKGWKNAITKKLVSHAKVQRWSEAELTKGKAAIEPKWVFKTKEDEQTR